MTSLKNKVALITGSARGIGKAIAERYGSLGANVVVNYATDETRARETLAAIERLGGDAIAVQADISRVADIERLFSSSLAKFGRLDVVVANAGVLSSHSRKPRSTSPTTAGSFMSGPVIPLTRCLGGRSTVAKIAPQFLVEVLAKEIGARDVAVNSIALRRSRARVSSLMKSSRSSWISSDPFVPCSAWAR